MKTVLPAISRQFLPLTLLSIVLFFQQNTVQAQCSGLADITLNVVAAPEPTIDGDDQFCPGNSVTLTVPGSFDTYNWSNGGNGPSINVGTPGTYTVTVTNSAGCSGTASQAVTQSPAPTPNITTAPYQCNGEFTLDAGTGFTSYNWSNGDNTQTVIVSNSGNFSVTVTDANGCTGTDDFTVTIPPPPSVDISGNLSFCDGANTVLSATPGFTQYIWTGGSTGPNLTVSTSGTYNVTATDAFGCTDVATAVVDELPFTPPTVSGGTVLCPGSTVTLTANGANYTSYNWSNGQTGQSITVSTTGVFTVTVTADNGCTGTASATVNPGSSTTTNIIGNTIICNGNSTTLIATGSFQTYNWSNGASGSIITVNQTGPYSVTVTTNQGCTGTATATVTEGVPPNVSIAGPTEFCPGANITLTAQPGGLTYLWSNGNGGQSISVNQAGMYSVTATDANGCSNTAATTITAAPAPSPVIAGPAEICAGTSGTLSVNSGFADYNWSTGQSTQSITVSNPGNYFVTVTDFNGCTGVDNFNLIVNPAPTPNITAAPYACNGQLTLNAGAGFAAYNWSNGGNTQTITVTNSGNFFVTVTDANGCTGVDNFIANIPPLPSVSITGDDVICQDETTTFFATPGFSNYFWSTGQNGNSIIVDQAGLYEVTATDAFGCTATDAVTLTVQTSPNPVISGPTSICVGSTATYTVSGSFSAYNWSNGGTGPSITVSAAGTYTVTVTAANGCTGTDDVTLTLSNSLQPQIVAQPYQCDGQITLDAGAGFTFYDWSNSGNGQVITVSASGNYSVTVTDATGCTGTDVISVTIPTAPVVDITGDNQICPGETTALSATPGFDYLWSNGGNTQTINVNAAGNYTVTATDAFGCTATDALTVTALAAPSVSISGPTTICTGSTATFDAGNFSNYFWSTGETTQTITTDVAGNYSVIVTAANGCTATDDIDLSIANGLAPQITAQPYTCNGQITLDAGAGFLTYSWSNGANSQTLTVNNSDNYSVTVTDATGCTGTDIIAVTIPTAPVVDVTGDSQICPGETTALTATPGFDYLWSNGGNTQTINVNAAGNYAVTATDAFGCTATDAITVTALAAPSVSISGPTTICTGNTATFDAGNFPNYLWSTGETTQTITTGTAGNYSVIVTAANGCTATDDIDLTVASGLSPQITPQPYACNGQITLDAGAGFLTYNWSNGGNGQTVIANSSGDYFVTVTDATGCTGTAVAAVVIPPAPQVSISGNTVFCENSNTALEATAGFANYLWNNGETTATIEVNNGGTFTVTATDAFGCTDTESISVTAQPLPLPDISGPSAVCDGATATFSVNGNFAQTLWSNGANGASITVNAAGNYIVTVTDAIGCAGADSVQLTVNPNPVAQITEQPYLCNGQLTLDAGAGFATYIWSNLGNGQTVNVNNSGNYSVTVTDANGCSGTAELAVTVPTLPQVSIAGDSDFCQGSSTNLSADAGFVSYLWSNGETSQTVVASTSGNFVVTATDALGCTATASVQVTAFNNPAPVIAGPTAVCPTSTATLSVPGNYASFQWSIPGAAGNSVTVQPPVSVEVTVTDANGCTGTASASVAVSNQLSPNIIAQPYLCDGQITLDAGAGFASYIWNNGGNAQTISVSNSGNYNVTVSDGGGCSGTATIQVDVPTVPQVFISGPSSFCQNESVVISATPGFVTYLWSTGDITPDISVNNSSAYSVTVTDASGCSASTATAVTGVVGPAPVVTGPTTLCEGGTATFSLDETYVSYLWSDGSTGETFSANTPGDYAVTVTDATGCTGLTGFSLSVSPNPAPIISAQPYQCDGQITLTVSGAGDTYLWSNGLNTPSIAVTNSGNYSVTATNAAGCTGIAVIEANVPTPPSVAISGNNFICANETTSLTATPGLTNYVWSNGQNSQVITVGAAGNFSVTATDALGCTATADFAVNAGQADTTLLQATTCDPQAVGTDVLLFNNANGCDSLVITETTLGDALTASATVVSDFNGFDISCAGENDGAATVTPLAGQAPFTFQWSNGATTSSAQNLNAGIYSVTVTDVSGCSGTASVTLAEPLPVTPTLLAENPTCQNAGAISVENVAGGFGPYTVRLVQDIGVTNGQEPLEFDALGSGTFAIEITDANGCVAEETVVLLPPTAIQEFVSDTIEIEKGDTITLNPAITITPVNIDWTTSSGQLSCDNCLTPSLAPVLTTTVQLDVQGFGECAASAIYFIIIADAAQVYIPNVIAPESTDNFSFTVYGDERVIRVRSLQIYDRWGGQMALIQDFAPNDPAQGWDGTYRGQVVQPGVYVYWAEVEYADGSTEIFSGDVTVLR
jgi:hypothetical protein